MKPFNPKEYKRDIAVLNLHKGNLMLVFPTGSIINDINGLLEGNFPDTRKIIKFTNYDDVLAKKESLQKIIRNWLELVEK